ncbi:DUF2244 domain-containing protein [Aquibium oceanicum]|uniref:DUF2244 domain-containing protein n=1 Tax=Aquibium oceanicum TaxID=1670800 RepID=A0A1L3SLZ0_9HYPH|nr:DUF2244 domain-containing protein [Aquibium oceanicum]APH70332.1 hypothetical protein BSQ44_02225 [Aquibium oceanicum]
MHETNAADEPIFSALLTPHRSLGPRGFAILMGIIGTISFSIGLLFWSIGAWPIVGFFGLDVLLIYGAFRMNYRAARAREEVSVSRTRLDIRKFAPSGRSESHQFNPFWAKFAVSRHEEIGITRMAVEGQGRNVTIGSFLNPDDRESFATAFGRALATAKAG